MTYLNNFDKIQIKKFITDLNEQKFEASEMLFLWRWIKNIQT